MAFDVERAVEEFRQARVAINERPEIAELWQASDDASNRVADIEQQMIATRATTLEGLAVKRPIVEGVLSDDDNEFGNLVFWSIFADAEHCIARCAS